MMTLSKGPNARLSSQTSKDFDKMRSAGAQNFVTTNHNCEVGQSRPLGRWISSCLGVSAQTYNRDIVPMKGDECANPASHIGLLAAE